MQKNSNVYFFVWSITHQQLGFIMLKLGFISIILCNSFMAHHSVTLERYAQAALIADDENILELIEDSASFKPLKEKFCDKVITSYPKKVRRTAVEAYTHKLKQNCLILYGTSGVGKSLLARIIAQKNGKPFLLVRSYYIENRTSENLCKIATVAAEKNCNLIIEEIEVFIKEELRHQNVTSRPLTNMLKILQAHNLLLIGTTFENQLAVSLKRTLDVTLCHLDTPKDILSTVRTINASLIYHKTNIDSAQTIIDFAQLVSDKEQCTIEHIISLAQAKAQIDIIDSQRPTITLGYLKEALTIINHNTDLLNGKSSKKESVNYCIVQ